MMNKRSIGDFGERLAVKFLLKKGIKITEKNYKNYLGEIDLIGKDKDEFVFIEVKLRKTSAYGFGFESVGKKKQERIFKSALLYLKQKKEEKSPFRIDVVSIDYENKDIPTIRYFKNAVERKY